MWPLRWVWLAGRKDEGVGANTGAPSDGERVVPIPDCIPGPSGIKYGNETPASPSPEPASVVSKSFQKNKR